MSGKPLPRVFGLLGLEKDPAVDDALCEAMPHLDVSTRETALKLICQRGNSRVMHRLLVSSPGFEPDLREAIFRRLDDFQGGLRSAMQSMELADRAAAISVVAAARDFKSLPLLGDALRSSCSRTRELAGNAIRAFVQVHLAEPDGRHTQRFDDALRGVIATWELHHHAGALEAALWLIDLTEPALADKLEHSASKIIPALRALLDRMTDPRLTPFAVRSLLWTELRPHAIRALGRLQDATVIAALLDEMWMLCDPQIERTMHGVKEWDALHRRMIEVGKGHPARSAAAVRVIAACGSAQSAATRFAELADQSNEPLQRAVLWQLVGNDSDTATQTLRSIASRTNDARSAVARRECMRRERRDPGTYRAKPKGGVLDALEKALNRFADEQEQLSAPERSALGEQLRSFGADLIRALERRLSSPLAQDRVTTLHAIRTLGLVSEMLPRVYAGCRDSDVVVRVAALKLLAGDAGATTTRLLRDALHDPDPRVQAVAVELSEVRGIDRVADPIREKLASPHNRVRANAIKALWNVQVKDAAQALESMLKDASAPHRISALWVVERLRVREILARLVEMERSDPDPQVRGRARRVLRGWTEQGAKSGASHSGGEAGSKS